MRDSAFKNVLVNLRTVFSTNVRKRLNEDARRITALEDAMAGMDRQMVAQYHYLNVLDYFARHEEEANAYRKELDFLQSFGKYAVFPYQQDTALLDVVSGFDEEAKLSYVLHHGKKLFFPSGCSPEDASRSYLNYLQTEKLLGVDDAEDAPHQYQSPRVHVEEGDVVFDIGAAEGLFALDQIDKASRVVIVENDPQWMEPLRHTFASYSNKVHIINRFISSIDTDNTMSMKTLLSDLNEESLFVKMDIEGNELPAIVSAGEALGKMKNVKIVAAAYHRQHDAEELKAVFESIGFTTEFAKGFMLFHLYDTPAPPYFRHGVLRAKRNGL